MTHGWKIWIDTGGTFTDCLAATPWGEIKRLKVLSNGVLRLKILEQTGSDSLRLHFPSEINCDFLERFTLTLGTKIYKIKKFNPDTSEVWLNKSIRKSNAVVAEITTHEEVPVFASRILTQTALGETFPAIELKLGSTRGTNALLERKGARSAFLVTKGFRDLLLIRDQQRPDLFALNIIKPLPLYHTVLEVDERMDTDGSVLTKLTGKEISRISKTLKNKNIDSVAIALLNSYRNPSHEIALEQQLRKNGFQFVSTSHSLSKEMKILPRAETTVVNGYLDPIIQQYVSAIGKGTGSSKFFVMSSAGGLLHSTKFHPKDSLLSGPAGGVIGSLKKAQQSGINKIITFDMGGTSTDVSLCNKRPDYRFDCSVGNLKILSPSLAIETIAAGGGSICDYDGYKFLVGPHSAGAAPGPACYGAGGPLTMTDVNLLLGRLDKENFSIPIDPAKAEKKLDELLCQINHKKRKPVPEEQALESWIQIANEKMAEAIRKVSVQRGHDTKEYSLLCFGGAGGQHACALASMLDVARIIVPYDAGLLSAYGIGQSNVEQIKEQLILKPLEQIQGTVNKLFEELADSAKQELAQEGLAIEMIAIKSQLLFLRLQGQETSIEVEYQEGVDIRLHFVKKYKRLYGHWIENRPIEVESIRVIVSVRSVEQVTHPAREKKYLPPSIKSKRIFVQGNWHEGRVFRWEDLLPGASVIGPSLVISNNSTLLVEPGWEFFLDSSQNAIITRSKRKVQRGKQSAEANLELYTNRFASIAYDMGAMLQRSAFSVNVKERLDFSCALLNARGQLIVNAPHIPVHLGSLGVCVREVQKAIRFQPGDVIITNHPGYGGSHLPDITLIKPVYRKGKLIAFVANRAHHAEIGGKKPGSMPADAICLEEEGVVIPPLHLVRRGKIQWNKIENILTSSPFPTRALQENLADINAALASLIHGEKALLQLINKFGQEEVIRYMDVLCDHADTLLTNKIKSLTGKSYTATERLDDGSQLKVWITVQPKKLTLDFSGSSPVHGGNFNATKAIVNSVVLYVLRLLVNEPLPLNEGLLKHVKLIIPPGMLNPKFYDDNKKSPAVVGGNTEVSQRLTDTILKAFGLSACSQGTMNNLLFGNERFGYYETICGGTGAGPGFAGTDAVHQHMTNTRITDPEIMEHRYPVRLIEFCVRKGSGGKGKWNGGDGVERTIHFKDSLEMNILSQHRTEQPYGMKGGESGKCGEQYLIRVNGKKHAVKGVDGITVERGDILIIKTPGGGAWGKS